MSRTESLRATKSSTVKIGVGHARYPGAPKAGSFSECQHQHVNPELPDIPNSSVTADKHLSSSRVIFSYTIISSWASPRVSFSSVSNHLYKQVRTTFAYREPSSLDTVSLKRIKFRNLLSFLDNWVVISSCSCSSHYGHENAISISTSPSESKLDRIVSDSSASASATVR